MFELPIGNRLIASLSLSFFPICVSFFTSIVVTVVSYYLFCFISHVLWYANILLPFLMGLLFYFLTLSLFVIVYS